MSYARGEISTETAALAMAENIRAVMQTQTLTEAEQTQLMDVLAEIVGDVGLAEAYVGVSVTNAEVTVKAYVDSKAGAGDNGNGGTMPKTAQDFHSYTNEIAKRNDLTIA